MARNRTLARRIIRLGIIAFVGAFALFLTDAVPGGLEKWLGFVGASIVALVLVALACALTQGATGWFPGLGCRLVLPAVTAVSVVFVPGLALSVWGELTADHSPRVPSRTPKALDVLLIQPSATSFASSSSAARLTPEPDEASRWNVRYSVASTTGGSLMLTLRRGSRRAAHRAVASSFEGAAQTVEYLQGPATLWPIWRQRNVARAIVLNVDGIHGRKRSQQGTNTLPRHWRAVLKRARERAPVFALLRDAGTKRLNRWRRWTERTGGDAMLLRETGRHLLVDAAVRIATERRVDFTYEALAWRHRPRLRFDVAEPLPNPLDVDKFLKSDVVRACSRIESVVRCPSAKDPRALTPGIELSFDASRIDVRRLPGALYYHALPHGDRLHIDYWWYFPYNPTAVGRRFLCGPGRLTCFDHVSDWEGLTVVLENDGRNYFPTDVIYAQHEFGVAYTWADLQGRWERAGLLDGERPLAYVAKDSHASYPEACTEKCKQIEPLGGTRKEVPHLNTGPWPMNEEAACRGVCLKRLPQTRTGTAALWNASPFAWGKQNCLLVRWFCGTAAAPLAPRYQGRFLRPWRPLSGKAKEFRKLGVRYSKYA